MTGCFLCHKSKAPYHCGLCQGTLCKACAIFREDETLAFMPRVPADLTHEVYCGPCFNRVVEPQIASYRETLLRARNVDVFFKDQGKETRLIKRSEKPLKVEDCRDREETLLRLAFQAAQKGYNTLVDVDLVGRKVRVNGYQSTIFSAVGVPAEVSRPSSQNT